VGASLDGNYNIYRAFLLFDTSSLDDAAVVSGATIYLRTGNSVVSATVHAVSSSPASNTAIVSTDFNDLGATSFGSVTPSVTFTWYSIDLSATGYGLVSLTGITKYGLKEAHDLDNTTPAAPYYTVFSSADAAGTSTDPYLRVTYTVGGGNTGAFLPFLM
jgi:hypothetical protein